ncbi:hypothetical protein FB45DRAFT_870953 [Roridomyces roridus]|uniref:Uncharacterized protein n=1 Tax=Roridomyces roridus TaxID=1738132 RepID=A0AAD7BHI8_9AGAR|nr:hypothetical protein FB45DRAFT_870953 [Roridomyces roridus]
MDLQRTSEAVFDTSFSPPPPTSSNVERTTVLSELEYSTLPINLRLISDQKANSLHCQWICRYRHQVAVAAEDMPWILGSQDEDKVAARHGGGSGGLGGQPSLYNSKQLESSVTRAVAGMVCVLRPSSCPRPESPMQRMTNTYLRNTRTRGDWEPRFEPASNLRPRAEVAEAHPRIIMRATPIGPFGAAPNAAPARGGGPVSTGGGGGCPQNSYLRRWRHYIPPPGTSKAPSNQHLMGPSRSISQQSGGALVKCHQQIKLRKVDGYLHSGFTGGLGSSTLKNRNTSLPVIVPREGTAGSPVWAWPNPHIARSIESILAGRRGDMERGATVVHRNLAYSILQNCTSSSTYGITESYWSRHLESIFVKLAFLAGFHTEVDGVVFPYGGASSSLGAWGVEDKGNTAVSTAQDAGQSGLSLLRQSGRGATRSMAVVGRLSAESSQRVCSQHGRGWCGSRDGGYMWIEGRVVLKENTTQR